MFCLTQWPSPEEYSQLELQTKLGRTDIVRWFKDHRSALKNGETLDWLEAFQRQNLAEERKVSQHQNGQISESIRSVALEVKASNGECCRRTSSSGFDLSFPPGLILKNIDLVDPATVCAAEEAGGNVAAVENSKLSVPDKGRWLAERLTQGETDLSRTGQNQNSCGASDKGR